MTASEKRQQIKAEALEEYRKELTRKMVAKRWGDKTPEQRSAHAAMMAKARYKKKKKPLAST